MKYERITTRRETPLVMSMWPGDSESLKVYNRLAELEDKIESGELVEVPQSEAHNRAQGARQLKRRKEMISLKDKIILAVKTVIANEVSIETEDGKTIGLYLESKDVDHIAEQVADDLSAEENRIRRDTVKEFAEKLKSHVILNYTMDGEFVEDINIWSLFKDIENLVEEVLRK